MKIFIATAKLDDIRWAHSHGLVDGVLTTPTSLMAEVHPAGAHDLLAEICRVAAFPVAAMVGAVNASDVYRDARELAKLSDSIIVQIPFVEDAIEAIRRLSAEGIRVTATLVFNAAQAVLAAKAGAGTVCVHIDQIDAQGQDGVETIAGIHHVFQLHGVECDVLAAMPRNAAQFTGCALGGADSIAVSPETLRALLLHPLTDRGIDQFLTDLSRTHRTRVK
jgi:transaldolase